MYRLTYKANRHVNKIGKLEIHSEDLVKIQAEKGNLVNQVPDELWLEYREKTPIKRLLNMALLSVEHVEDEKSVEAVEEKPANNKSGKKKTSKKED